MKVKVYLLNRQKLSNHNREVDFAKLSTTDGVKTAIKLKKAGFYDKPRIIDVGRQQSAIAGFEKAVALVNNSNPGYRPLSVGDVVRVDGAMDMAQLGPKGFVDMNSSKEKEMDNFRDR